MTPTLHIQTFGGLILRIDDRVLGIEIPVKAKAMLAYIARQNAPQPREKLAYLFWTDFPAERVAHNLRLALPPLREYLSEYVEITRTEITVNARLDAVDFEQTLDTLRPFIAGQQPFTAPEIKRFEDALALYRGDFFAHIDLPDASAFDEWVSTEREALRVRFIAAGSRLLEALTTMHSYHDGIDLALRLLNADPLHEDTHRRLMLLYAVSGDRTSALQLFERLQTNLWDEIGVEPDDETIALYERIAANEIEVVPDTPLALNGHLPPTNLPGELSPFLGRENELTQIAALLAETRCVTLVGTGGIGKTRLALKTAERQRLAFPDGVFWVELAPLLAPSAVADAVYTALGIEEARSSSSITEEIAAFVRDKHLLLVLDNFEHVLDAVDLVEHLLRAAPALRVLVTSREPLRLYGEYCYDMPALTRAEAAHLFIDRAKAIQPRFQADDPALLDALCARLDDLPLALELAASGARSLSLAKILARLDAARLQSPLRGIPERQRTLFNTIEWSYHLLTAEEQALYRRLAYFVGTWTSEAAAAVCGEADGLDALVEKSLLRRTEDEHDEARYSMLETIRQHARLKLNEAGEAAITLHAYLDYYAAYGETANVGLRGRDEALWMRRLRADFDNLHAALEYANEAGDGLIEARMVAALGRFWYFADYHREAQAFGERALRHRDLLPPDVLAGLLATLGLNAFVRSEPQQAEVYHREALTLYEQVGDLHGQAMMNMFMSVSVTNAKATLVFSRHAYELLRDSDEIMLYAAACNNFALYVAAKGHLTKAMHIAQDGLERVRGVSQIGEGLLINLLSTILRDQGQFEAALTTLQTYFLLEERSFNVYVNSLIEQSGLLLYLGRLDEAVSVCNAAMDALQSSGHMYDYRNLQRLRAAIADAYDDSAQMKAHYIAAYSGIFPDTLPTLDTLTLSVGLAHLVLYFTQRGCHDEAQMLQAGLERELDQHEYVLSCCHHYYLDKAAPLLANTPSPSPDAVPDNPFAYALECLARL